MSKHLCLALALLLLALFPLPARSQQLPKCERYALLVGVTKYPGLEDSWELDGPVNDVELMRKLLAGRFGFRDDGKHIRVLSEATGQKDPALLPTLRNIKREFDTLARPGVLKPGDQVVILLAGHGSQQEADWTRPNNYEPDGLDEVFLPRDAVLKNEKWQNGIVDDDLRDWVDRLSDPKVGALVWVILDSCHSGTMLRAVGKERTRSVPLSKLIAKERLAKFRAEGAKRFPQARGKPQEPQWVPESPNVAAIYAAQSFEMELETTIPGSGDDKTYGLLTYNICAILESESSRRLTYLDLVQRVQQRYVAQRRIFPTPQAEGKLVDRVVLSFAKTLPQRPPIYLSSDGQTGRINAGLLHGLTPDSILAVYPLVPKDKDDKPLGYVAVRECRTAEADVRPCAYQGQKANRDLPGRAVCKVVAVSTGDLRLALALDPLTAKGEKLPPDQANKLHAVLRQLAEAKDAPVQLLAAPVAHCWLVRLDALSSGQLHLVPPDRQGVGYGPIPVGESMLASLQEKTAQIARAQNLLKIVSLWKDQEASDDAEDVQAVKVALEVFRLKGTKRLPLPRGTRPDVQDGELIGFRLHNKSAFPVDMNLLFVNADFAITSFFPKTPGTENRVGPGETRFLRIRVSADAAGVDHWVLIAVKAEPETPWTNFLYLTQPSLAKARGTLTQGQSRGGPIRQMDTLLLKALFPRAGVRGDSHDVSSNCAVEMLSYRSLPR